MRGKWLLPVITALALWGCDGKNTFSEAPDFNEKKNFAEAAYIRGEYDTAAYVYGYLVDSAGYLEPLLMLNQAHALYQVGDTTGARKQYERLLDTEDSTLQSRVYNQLGILAAKNTEDQQQSLELFKNALLTNPDNELARYNYEITKMLSENEMPDGPSEFAKQLKEKSDRLVSEFRFAEAYRLMMQGLMADMTVSYYADYIQRLGDITEIEENQP